MKIILRNGYHYYAGIDRPWYASRGAVTDELQKRGFVSIQWHKRGEPLPSNVDLAKLTKYDDDWTEWVRAIYTGTATEAELPMTPSWIALAAPLSGETTPMVDDTDEPEETSSRSIGVGTIVTGLLLLMLLVRR